VKRWAPLVWLSIIVVAGWILAQRLQTIDFGDVLLELRAQPLPTALIALACSVGVYGLVGVYEAIGVRFVTGRSMFAHAFRTSLIANPIGRAIGAAIVSGGALRYRMYSAIGMSAGQIATVVVIVAMPYFFAVGWLIDLSLLFNAAQASKALRLPASAVLTLGAIGLAKDIGWLIFVSRRRQPIVIRKQSISLPSLPHALLQIAIGLAQISLMTAILYLFMPPELDMSWPAFIAIYCIAFVAGQLSNVPAGLGVLEAALLLMLPHVPPAKLFGAVIAYRAVYELLPLLVALTLLVIYESSHPAGVIRKRLLGG
jgi:glycosyltransferase 2 family protein